MFIYKAGVVGAGTMGAQIAQVVSFSGLPVVLIDQTSELAEKGMQTIRNIYASRVKKGKMTEMEAEQKISLVTVGTDYALLSDVDIVVEAISEDMTAKRALFKKLDGILPESSIIASNTSALSISEFGAATNRPERVVGLHFFNPAHVMKLVEVIPSMSTSIDVVDDVISFAESLRKIPVRVNECSGFLVNRLLMPYLNEAVIALQEGAGSMRDIDEAMVNFGMPMGPFTLIDMIGIDISERVAFLLADAFGQRMQSAAGFAELLNADRLGQKSGAGFYTYKENMKDFQMPVTAAEPTVFSVERLLLPMVNEAVICCQEGVSSLTDIDIAMVAGTGFPQDMGGPLHWADSFGLDNLLVLLEKYKEELGERFRPAPMIKRMVSSGFVGVKKKRGFFNY